MNKAQDNALGRFWNKLQEYYTQSLCCLILQSIAECWRESWIYHTACQLLGAAPAKDRSQIKQRLCRVNRRLESYAGKISAAVDGSLFCRLARRLLQLFRQSYLLGWLFADGISGLLLFAVGGYVLWDWLLRDVFTIPVFSSLWDEMLLLISFAWLLYQRMAGKNRLDVNDTPMDMPVLFFLAVSLILLFMQFNAPAINIAGLRASTQYILWFFVVTRLIRTDKNCMKLYGFMVLIASAVALYGVYQYIIGAPMPAGWTDQAEASVRTRVYAIFSSCNIMGDYMVLFAPMAAGVAYAAKNRWLQLFAWGCTGVMCLSCLLTMSRGAWIALIVAILVFALLVDLRLLVLMGFAGAAALCLPFVQSRIGYMFTDAYERSANRGGRSVRWKQAIEYLFAYDPALGMGHGRFGGAIAMQNPVSPNREYFYTDNYYVKVLSETGFFGLFGYLVMQLCLLWTGLKAWFCNVQKCSRMSPLCAGMLSGMLGVLVHCIFENIFEEPYMMATFWTVAAMTMYLGFLRPETEDK